MDLTSTFIQYMQVLHMEHHESQTEKQNTIPALETFICRGNQPCTWQDSATKGSSLTENEINKWPIESLYVHSMQFQSDRLIMISLTPWQTFITTVLVFDAAVGLTAFNPDQRRRSILQSQSKPLVPPSVTGKQLSLKLMIWKCATSNKWK